MVATAIDQIVTFIEQKQIIDSFHSHYYESITLHKINT